MLWARGEMMGTIALEIAETDAFTNVVQYVAIEVEHANDCTGETPVLGLDAGEDYYYRVIPPVDVVTDTATLPTGRFITAPATATPLRRSRKKYHQKGILWGLAFPRPYA